MSFRCTAFYVPPKPLSNPRLEEVAPGRFQEFVYENESIYVPAVNTNGIRHCPRCKQSFAAQRGHSCSILVARKLQEVE